MVMALMHSSLLFLIALTALPVWSLSQPSEPREGRNNLNLLLSFVRLAQGHPDLADNDQELGLEFDTTPKGWPVAIEAGLFFGLRERRGSDLGDGGSTSFRARTLRFGLGPRKYWRVHSYWRPTVAGGPALVYRTVNYGAPRNGSDSDLGFGGWLATGLIYNRNRFNLGLEARAYIAKLELGNRTGTP